MKKTLLCFLLLFTIVIYSQGSASICVGETFNLPLIAKNAIGNLNPNNAPISFHYSLGDVLNNTKPIANPSNYNSTSNNETIYVRIEGVETSPVLSLTVIPALKITATHIPIGTVEQTTSLTINATGGSNSYKYSLNGGPFLDSNIFNSLGAGVYLINVLDDTTGCITSISYNLTTASTLTVTATVTEAENCGDKDTVTITATGGQGQYLYSFEGVNYSTLNTTNNLLAGTYTLYAKDQIGNIASTIVKVNNFKYDFNSIATVTTISCQNEKGSITALGIGGKLPYQYSLNGEPYTSNNIFNNLVSGHYTINTKDASGCVSSNTLVIFPYTPLIANVSVVNASCYGSMDGSINIVATGGAGPYKYSLKDISGNTIINPQTANTFTFLDHGDYTVEIIDQTACTLTMYVSIQQPIALYSTAVVEDQTITINTTGGSGKYLYSIDYPVEKQSSNIFTNVIFGNHEIYVIDENGCYNLFYVNVDPPAPSVNGKTTVNIEFKQGQTLGDLVIDGQNIKWYSTPGNSQTGKTSKSAVETPLPLSTILVDGITYYASQTISGIESKERLAVIAKVNGSLSTPDFELANFNFYPNPVKHILSIKNQSTIEHIQIFSVSGKSILSKNINNTHSDIDLSALPTGMYILNVKADGKEKAVKFIKE